VNLDGQRTAIQYPDTTPSSAQIEEVLPVYVVDDEILAATPTGGTGVETEGESPEPVTLEDLNVDARAWCQID